MTTLWQDIRYGLRMLMRNPGFAVASVLTLALGIGACTAVFSAAHAVLFRPLPYQEPERLVAVWRKSPQSQQKDGVSYNRIAEWAKETSIFAGVAGYWHNNIQDTFLRIGQEDEPVAGVGVSPDFFMVLGVRPILGRSFGPEDEATATGPGAADTTTLMLSHALWQRRFGDRPDIVGQSLIYNGTPHTVVGVLPADFRLFQGDKPEILTPMPTPFRTFLADDEGLQGVARLQPGVGLERAQAAMAALSQRLQREHPDTHAGAAYELERLHDFLFAGRRPVLLVLLVTVGFVLLIACANVANLLLARSAGREKEIALRAALGAGRLRQVRQSLTESLVLSLLGGGLGLLLALWGVDALYAICAAADMGLPTFRIDGPVLGFALAASLLTAVLFGVAPGLRALRIRPGDTLKETNRAASIGREQYRLNGLLMMSEVALALVLLVGAALLIQTFLRLTRTDWGFRAERVLVMDYRIPEKLDRPGAIRFISQLPQRLQSLPGVESACVTDCYPLSDGTQPNDARDFQYTIVGRQLPPPGHLTARFRNTTPGYFRTLGIPLKQGRFFNERDDGDASKVCIINESFAREHWGADGPLGRQLHMTVNGLTLTIVGVVGDVRHYGPRQAALRREVFMPFSQFPNLARFLVVRTAGQPLSAASTLRETAHTVDTGLGVMNIVPLREVVSNSLIQDRLATLLMVFFGILGLAQATLGVYGVVSYGVSQRTREIGIRIAMGARTRDVLTLILRQTMWRVMMGTAVGVLASLALTRLLAGLLFGVGTADLKGMLGVTILLLAVTLLASYLPARRAARIDPMVALRYE